MLQALAASDERYEGEDESQDREKPDPGTPAGGKAERPDQDEKDSRDPEKRSHWDVSRPHYRAS